MEQDGNTAMSKSPDFSSQNNPVTPPAGAITSAIDQSSSQDIAAAAAALPDIDRPAITSNPSASTSHMFGRHFKPQASKPQQQVAAPAAFAGAPDFFNEAAAKNTDYITIGQDTAPRSSNKKRFIIIGVLAVLLVVVIVVAVSSIAPSVGKSIASSAASSEWTRISNKMLFGEEKNDALPEEKPSFADTDLNEMDSDKNESYLKLIDDFEDKNSDVLSAEAVDSLDLLADDLYDLSIIDSVVDLGEQSFLSMSSEPYADADAYWQEIMKDYSLDGIEDETALDSVKSYVLSNVNLYRYFIESGCVISGVVEQECRGRAIMTEYGDMKAQELLDSRQQLIYNITQYHFEVINLIYKVGDLLNNSHEGNS